MRSSLEQTVGTLCGVSRRKVTNPYTDLDWAAPIEEGQWLTSPELVSLHGTSVWERMDDAARVRLSFLEAVNFCSLNLHGEKALVEGLSRRLYDPSNPVWIASSPYLHHFIDEENKHMVYFGEFCRRYAGKVYRDRKISLARKYAPGEEDFLFFARVLIFETIVDVHNQRMSNDERLAPIARRINTIHHLEETRHLVFGRQIVRELFEQHAPGWPRPTLEGVQSYLEAYLTTAWREYTHPDVYADAGFDEPYELAERVFRDAPSRERRREMSAGVVRFLLEHGMLAREPEL